MPKILFFRLFQFSRIFGLPCFWAVLCFNTCSDSQSGHRPQTPLPNFFEPRHAPDPSPSFLRLAIFGLSLTANYVVQIAEANPRLADADVPPMTPAILEISEEDRETLRRITLKDEAISDLIDGYIPA